jgi:hypothetical protein
MAKFIKFARIYDGDQHRISTHIIVSGNRFLTNSHLCESGFISVYNTHEHFENKHAEIENIRFKTISVYPSCDLRVCEFINIHAFYPVCKPIFKTRKITPLLILHTSLGKFDLIFDKNMFLNDIVVEYTGYTRKEKYSHGLSSGLFTPIEAEGLCGSFIINSDGDIIAVHVAGDSVSRGFCAIPSTTVVEQIREELFYVRTMSLEVDSRVKSNFSGTRLVYPKNEIETSYVNGKTKIVPTIFHIEHSIDMKNLTQQIRELDEPIVIDPVIDKRGLPIIKHPNDKLKEISKKSFMNQGEVSLDELKFIKDCIRTLMPKTKYKDLTDEEAAFGSLEMSKINKDSSNGYGHPAKSEYFDFENKTKNPLFERKYNNMKKGFVVEKSILRIS